MSESIFRTQALEAQRRIDELPKAMGVTTAFTRLTLGVLAGGLLTAAIWSAFVIVPVRVQASGVFIDASGELLKPLRAPMEGVIEQFLVTEGEYVRAGQEVARLRLPDRVAALDKATRNLASLQEQLSRTEELQAYERHGDDRVRQVKVQTLDRRISDLELRLAFQRERETAQEGLLSKGATTHVRAFEAKASTHMAVDQLANARSELSAILSEILIAEGRRERERLTLQLQIEQAKSEIGVLQSELARGSRILSSIEGTVAELSADRNGLVSAGQPVLSVIPRNASGVLSAVAYVSLGDGKLVKPGNEVLIKPGSLPRSEQGMIRAFVEEVSEAPITDRALTRVLGNAALVSQAANGGAPFAVRIAMERNKQAPSGYDWTSGLGPELRLTPGTPITAQVTIERATLLSLALPALRRMLMLDKDDAWGRKKS